jgi:hypothetical protein
MTGIDPDELEQVTGGGAGPWWWNLIKIGAVFGAGYEVAEVSRPYREPEEDQLPGLGTLGEKIQRPPPKDKK